MCFADFEFTCGFNISSAASEVLSAGIIICDDEYHIVEKYYSTARPNKHPVMTKQCRKLTKLTQDEINVSPDSNDVMRDICNILERYGISAVWVWGNFDRPGLLSDIKQHSKLRRPSSSIRRVADCISDIQYEMTKKMQLPQAVNIKELASAFGYVPEEGSFHNAINDAAALYTIHRAVHTTDFRSSEGFIKLREDRIEKLEAVRIAAEKRRLEAAVAIPLSGEEKEYYDRICSEKLESVRKRFIYVRGKAASALLKYPDVNDFILIVFSNNNGVKAIPASKLNPTLRRYSARRIEFSRDGLSELVLGECRRYE